MPGFSLQNLLAERGLRPQAQIKYTSNLNEKQCKFSTRPCNHLRGIINLTKSENPTNKGGTAKLVE